MQTIDKEMDKRYLILFSVLIVLIFGITFMKQKLIEGNHVYVLGHYLYSSDEGSETGWVHHFVYVYENKKYPTSFGAPIGHQYISDSLMYIKISPRYPSLCLPVTNVVVQRCIKLQPQPYQGWKQIPKCK